MEGVLFIPPNRPHRDPDPTCVECGRAFRPRRGGEGAEELCDACYDAQFEPRRIHLWQKLDRPHPRR